MATGGERGSVGPVAGSNEGQDSKEAQEKKKGKNANEDAKKAAWLFCVSLVESSSTLHEPILLSAANTPHISICSFFGVPDYGCGARAEPSPCERVSGCCSSQLRLDMVRESLLRKFAHLIDKVELFAVMLALVSWERTFFSIFCLSDSIEASHDAMRHAHDAWDQLESLNSNMASIFETLSWWTWLVRRISKLPSKRPRYSPVTELSGKLWVVSVMCWMLSRVPL